MSHIKMKKFISLLLVLIVTSGCVSLRKKFVRQKNKDKQDKVEPILDPIEYAPKFVSSEERYRRHFSLFRVWQRDFLKEMKEDFSDKRKIYLLNTVITELEAMKKYLIEEKSDALGVLIVECQTQLAALSKNKRMRRDSTIANNSRRIFSRVLNEFDPKKMGEVYN